MHMPIVANPELILLGNPRKRRRRRRKGSLRIRSHRRRRKNGGKSRGIHRKWGKVTTHKRRVNRGRRGGYAGFVKKHKALFKRMTFKQATKKIASMWKRK